jgi:hypothetical protein
MKPCDTEMGPFFQALDFLSPYFSGTFSSWEASYTQSISDQTSLSFETMLSVKFLIEELKKKSLNDLVPSRKEDSAPEKDEEPPKQGHDLLGYSKN